MFLIYLFAFLSLVSTLQGQVIPNPRDSGGWVADEAGYLKASGAIQNINQLIEKLENETGAEIAVVVLPSIGETSPKEFANALFETWGVGKKGKDNGILFLHVIDQRRLEIETGDGMEGILTDIKCNRILDDVVIPQFRSDNFSAGIYLGVKALERAIRNPEISISELTAPFEIDFVFTDPEIQSATTHSELPAHKTNLWSNFFKSPIQSILTYMISWSFLFFSLLAILFGELLNLFKYGSHKLYKLAIYFSIVPGYLGMVSGSGILLFNEIQETETFFTLLPGIALITALIFWNVSILNRLRIKPRKCDKCGSIKYRLSETHDDKYLNSGQKVEEKIKSRDYDVWECTNCKDIHIEEYSGERTVDTCPKCHFHTHEKTNIQVIRAADYNQGGEELHTYNCAHCKHQEVKRISTPKLQRSSSGSSGSGSSSGGSFGGGRSSGGGAGSSY